jgi:hypothetical protein
LAISERSSAISRRNAAMSASWSAFISAIGAASCSTPVGSAAIGAGAGGARRDVAVVTIDDHSLSRVRQVSYLALGPPAIKN